MNGDRANDVIYACRDSCQSLVYYNDGKGNFIRKVAWGPAKASTRAMAVADFDGDGHLDIVARHKSSCHALLEQWLRPVLQRFLHFVQELVRDSAVHNTMVVAQGDVAH